MMKVIKVLFAALLLGIVVAPSCFDQIVASDEWTEQRLASNQIGKFSVDEKLIAEAENAMIDFAKAREDLPTKFAFFARGQSWILNESQGIHLTEHVYLGARDEHSLASPVGNSSHFYLAVGARLMESTGGPDYTQSLGFTSWDQFLRIDNETYFRRGAGNKYDAHLKVGTDTEDKLIAGRRANANLDFFSAPITSYHGIRTANVSRSMVMLYLQRGKVVRAAKSGDKLAGIWEFDKKTYITVTFDAAQGGMPIKVENRNRTPDAASVEEVLQKNYVYSLIETQWKKQGSLEGTWLPVRIRGNAFTQSKTGSNHEGDFHIRWRFGESAADVFPPNTNIEEDWKNPGLQAFEADIQVPHKDYVAQRLAEEVGKK